VNVAVSRAAAGRLVVEERGEHQRSRRRCDRPGRDRRGAVLVEQVGEEVDAHRGSDGHVPGRAGRRRAHPRVGDRPPDMRSAGHHVTERVTLVGVDRVHRTVDQGPVPPRHPRLGGVDHGVEHLDGGAGEGAGPGGVIGGGERLGAAAHVDHLADRRRSVSGPSR
jgi:hypothetical protein